MPGGRLKRTLVKGDGVAPVVLAMWKSKPIVVEAPSLSGEKDVRRVTVCAAPAVAGRKQQTKSATTTIPSLDKNLSFIIDPTDGTSARRITVRRPTRR